MKKLFLSVMLSFSGVAVAAESFPPLVRRSVLEQPLPASNPVVKLVRGADIRFAPGQPTGLHYHPASTVGVVTSGSFKFQPEGEPERIIKTGDSFFEPANHKILRFDNASPTRPAAITVFYLVDGKELPLIKMLKK